MTTQDDFKEVFKEIAEENIRKGILFKPEEDPKDFAKIGLITTLLDDLELNIEMFLETISMDEYTDSASFQNKLDIFSSELKKRKELTEECKISESDINFIKEFKDLRNKLAHSGYFFDEPKACLINSRKGSVDIPSDEEMIKLRWRIRELNWKIFRASAKLEGIIIEIVDDEKEK